MTPTSLSKVRLWKDRIIIRSASSTPIQETTAQARLHPGVIAALVFVSFAAILAAVSIIRKYCFPRSDTIYRYSVLRRMEDEWSGETNDDDGKGTCTVGEDLDEDMLE
ncbi:hypothetical protein DPEC_G00199030 [Dallia pectoralis]|uniref:Uncharacterized protein n=1 Tax=Dallia pectoralis TaxID=75939 RepID=A0ACC2G8E5_DALPE|nr:hypothetical protein DPEC_G00199030 [Dallia pectoralis]